MVVVPLVPVVMARFIAVGMGMVGLMHVTVAVHGAVGMDMFVLMGVGRSPGGTVVMAVVWVCPMVMGMAVDRAIPMHMGVFVGVEGTTLDARFARAATAYRTHLADSSIRFRSL